MSTSMREPRGIPEFRTDAAAADQRASAPRFRHTLRGARRGIRGQSNFFVYFFFAALAVVGAVAFDATLADWCLLTLCVAGALTAEMFRSAIVAIATPWVELHPRCAEGIEIAGGAVLIAVCTTSAVALVVFAHRFGAMVGWWG